MSDSWTVPREWLFERCFIICGGESVRDQEHLIPRLNGRIIAIKQAVALRPDADVMFISGKDDGRVCAKFFPMFRGKYIVARGPYQDIPPQTKILKRAKIAERLSHNAAELAGLDAGASAMNLAYLFGVSEIVLLGYDLKGGRWLNDRYKHHLPYPPQRHFDLHLAQLPTLAEDFRNAGVSVINCSPTSAVTVFEKKPLETLIE